MAFLPEYLDPVFTAGCRAAMALILLQGAYDKLRDLPVFEASVDLYALLPASLVAPFSRAYPLAELAAALGLLFAPAWGAALAALVIGLASLGVAVNVLRGRTDLECGCGGERHPHLSWSLVGRNGLLLGLVALAAQPLDGALRTLLWVDYLSAAGLALALVGLYAALNQLLANQPFTLQTGKTS